MAFIARSLLIVTMLISCKFAFADGSTSGKVNLLQFWKDHPGVLVGLETMSDPDNCGRSDWYVVPDAHEHYKEIYALLLAANVSGQKVLVWVRGCENGFPKVANAMIIR